MQISDIVAALNEEISRLEQVRNLLANDMAGENGKGRGRPKGSLNRISAKRQMSEEGRERIAAAQRRRWAAVKQSLAAQQKAELPPSPNSGFKTTTSKQGAKVSSPTRRAVRPPQAASKSPKNDGAAKSS